LLQWWQSVAREIEKGLTANGLLSLIVAAVEDFPHNPIFQRSRSLDEKFREFDAILARTETLQRPLPSSCILRDRSQD
jgi:hypothetical protein